MENHTELTEKEKNLIARYLSGNLSPDDKETLTEWINKNPKQNQDILRQYSVLWQVSSTLGNKGITDIGKAKKNIFRLIKAKERQGRILHSGYFNRYLKAAALLVFVFSTTIFIYYMATGGLIKEEQRIITLSAPVGTQSDVILDDGTRVWLNSGSSLRYDSEFGKKNRNIELEGEAYFEVEKSCKYPFKVMAGEITVEVLGTRFLVCCYSDDETISTYLLKGCIELEIKETNQKFELEPGLEAVFDKNSKETNIESNNDPNILSWMSGGISFHNESFYQIIKKLQRRFDIKIVTDHNSIPNMRLTADFDQEDIEIIFKYLQEISNIKVTRKDNVYHISARE